MNIDRTPAAPAPRRVQLRMLGTSLRQVFTVRDDCTFDDLLQQLDTFVADRGKPGIVPNS